MFFDLALSKIAEQRSDGSMPPGHNGPYRDPETPVRTTAHWLVTWGYLAKLTSDKRYIAACHLATDYLLSRDARPMKASFYCRLNREKDACNGLIGQAWAIEGLLAAFAVLGREDALQAAKTVFYEHPFLEKRSIWRRVSVDGSYLSPDFTFNHQLWFAAIAAQIPDSNARQKAEAFLSVIGSRVQTYRNGVIFHQSKLGSQSPDNSLTISRVFDSIRETGSRLVNRKRLYAKSVGYHSFNLYAYAMLKEAFPNHSLWHSSQMMQMINATKNSAFARQLRSNIYGYPYNPSGIELAYVGEVFDLGGDYSNGWIRRQMEITGDRDLNLILGRDVSDQNTVGARIYEATRLRNCYTI